MARDNQILVRLDDKSRDTAVPCADPGLVLIIRGWVQLQAEPCTCPTDLLADRGSVLANTRGEHKPVEPAEHGGKRADLARDVVAEEIYCEARAGCIASQQLAKIGGHA